MIDETQYQTLHQTIAKNFTTGKIERLEKYRAKVTDADKIKIPAAFLIEICELKGAQVGGAKINEPQPLVILNTGSATANDVMNLFKKVRQTVFAKTGVSLNSEPELIGFSDQELNNYFEM